MNQPAAGRSEATVGTPTGAFGAEYNTGDLDSPLADSAVIVHSVHGEGAGPLGLGVPVSCEVRLCGLWSVCLCAPACPVYPVCVPAPPGVFLPVSVSRLPPVFLNKYM